MNVIACDPFIEEVEIPLEFFDGQSLNFKIKTISKEEVLQQSDFFTLHVPAQKEYVIGTSEISQMKDGAGYY